MLTTIFEHIGSVEVAARLFFDRYPQLKKAAKKRVNTTNKMPYDEHAWNEYCAYVDNVVGFNNVVLVHSSVDGLRSMGVNTNDLLDLMIRIEKKGNTVVVPAFPITNLKEPNDKMPYDPNKTLCWTGLMPNKFIKLDEVVRSIFPYNTLAAYGPEAKKMISEEKTEQYVYGKKSTWRYCLDRDAVILFVGSPASNANTMGVHMVPDLMGDEWPIKNWYKETVWPVRIDGEIYNKSVYAQDDCWYKYCMENKTSLRLRKENVLVETTISGAYFGYVPSSQRMMNILINQARQGKLAYKIPHGYYK